MSPEDHVVDDGLVYEESDFDEARQGGNHSKNRHFELISGNKKNVILNISA